MAGRADISYGPEYVPKLFRSERSLAEGLGVSNDKATVWERRLPV